MPPPSLIKHPAPPTPYLVSQVHNNLANGGIAAITDFSGPAADAVRFAWMQRMVGTEAGCSALAHQIRADENSRHLWKFLPYLLLSRSTELVQVMIDLVREKKIPVADHSIVVRTICRQDPSRLRGLMALEGFLTPDTAITFSRFAPRELFGEFVDRFKTNPHINSLPVFSTPEEVGAYIQKNPEQLGIVQTLNFCGDEPVESDADFLLKGFWFIGPEIRECQDHQGWSDWIDQIFEFPGIIEADPEVSIRSGIGLELLLHKIRKTESGLLTHDLHRDTLPARTATRHLGEFLFYPPAMLCSQLLRRGSELAAKVNMPSYIDRITVEAARAAQEPEIRSQLKRELQLRGFWHGAAKAEAHQIDSVSLYGGDTRDVNTVMRQAILSPSKFQRYRVAETPGAKAAVLFGSYFKLDLRDPICNLETSARTKPFRCGCELQVDFPLEGRHLVYPYRAVLAHLGLTVTDQPGKERLVEVAHPPSATWLVQLVVLGLLDTFGLTREAEVLSVHNSVQGKFGPMARYVAYPQLVFSQDDVRKTNGPSLESTTGRLFSKGLVCLNQNTEPVFEGETPTVRTEFRTVRGGGPRSFRAVIQSVAETLLLAMACQSPDPVLNGIWNIYQGELSDKIETGPAELIELFNNDWYEASGDAFDPTLTRRLKIFRALQAVRDANVDMAPVKVSLQPCVTKAVRAIWKVLQNESPNGDFFSSVGLGSLFGYLNGAEQQQ